MPEEPIHTSDRVLEVKIEALSKLTDVRFGNQDKALENLDKKMDSIINAGYITKADYEKNEKEVSDRIEAIESQTQFNSRMIWIALGIFGTLSFFSPLIFHYLFKI